jgi:hypothetical protein
VIRHIPASAFVTLFLLFVYLVSGYRTFNGLSLLIGLGLLWFGWAVWAHLDRDVRAARESYEAALADLASNRIEETNR